jgi:hypothetical protein
MDIGIIPVLFAFQEAGKILGGVSPWTLRKHAQRKNIRIVRLGQRVFLDTMELDRIRREGLPRLEAKPSKAFRTAQQLGHKAEVEA